MGFISNIFQQMKNDRMNKRIDKSLEKSAIPLPKYTRESGLGNEQQAPAMKIYNANAQSWAPDLHPNGIEDSSWIKDYEYNGANGDLDITYRDDFHATFPNITPDQAMSFNNASSKGRWVHNNLKGKKYY